MKRILPFIFSVLLLFSWIITGCSGSQSLALKYMLSDEPITLDPQIATDTDAKIVIEALFEGLTRLDENNEPSPGVAESWDISPDGKTYTFHLREDALWSDEVPVTAKDFVYAFQRALHPETGSTTCQSLFCIENAEAVHQGKVKAETLGVSAPNDNTLVVELTYANTDFLRLTATTPFMPCREDYFIGTEGKYGLESSQIIGNGPFCMENRYSWEHGEYINLLRSTTYHGASSVAPYKLTMTIANAETDKNPVRLLQNEITCAAQISSAYLPDLQQTNCKTTTFSDTTWGLCFQTKSKNMQSLTIRKLFLQAINRETLLSYLPEGAEKADCILPPSTLWNGSSYRSQTSQDTYIKEDKAAVERLKDTDVPAITILCPDTPSAKALCNALIMMWNPAFGHYYNMEPLSEAELQARITSGNYEIALINLRGNAEGPAAFLSQFASTNQNNPAQWHNSSYDKLLQISANTTTESMLQNYRQAEQMLAEQAIFYPIYFENRTYATPKNLAGIVFHPYDIGIDFRNARKA